MFFILQISVKLNVIDITSKLTRFVKFQPPTKERKGHYTSLENIIANHFSDRTVLIPIK